MSIQKLLVDKYQDISNPKLGLQQDWKEKQSQKIYKGQIVKDGILNNVIFMDALLEFNAEKYKLSVIGLFEDNTGFEIVKSCIAPEGCNIDWSTIHCSFDLTTK